MGSFTSLRKIFLKYKALHPSALLMKQQPVAQRPLIRKHSYDIQDKIDVPSN